MKFNPGKSEANLQAEFYHKCREYKIPCSLEYFARLPGHRATRFDAVILKDQEIVALVEFKEYKTKPEERAQRWPETSQGQRYASYNLPVFLIHNVVQISKAILHLHILIYD